MNGGVDLLGRGFLWRLTYPERVPKAWSRGRGGEW